MTDGMRPRCHRSRNSTRGASKNVKKAAIASGMKTACAQYKHEITTTLTTVAARTTWDCCQWAREADLAKTILLAVNRGRSRNKDQPFARWWLDDQNGGQRVRNRRVNSPR